MDAETLRDLFRDFGPIDIRRMFGGQGVFVDGLIIALVARGELFLKADSGTIPAFERDGQTAFTYGTRNGEHVLTSYWRMPEALYDDTEELARWARDAHAAALRAQVKKASPKAVRKRAASAGPRRRASKKR